MLGLCHACDRLTIFCLLCLEVCLSVEINIENERFSVEFLFYFSEFAFIKKVTAMRQRARIYSRVKLKCDWLARFLHA